MNRLGRILRGEWPWPGTVEPFEITDEPCRCVSCNARAEGGQPRHRVLNGIEIRNSHPWLRYVNGRVAQAYWPGLRSDYAEGEVLDRAIRLAILAHHDKMARFVCNTHIE
jgi:hypothetical protein